MTITLKNQTITLKNQTIEYIIHYKKIKSIYIRIKEGKIVVSAPINTPISYIEQLIIKHQDRLLKNIMHKEPYALYKDQGYVKIFNQKYTIILRDINQRTCQIHDQYIYVYHKDIQKCIEDYLKQILDQYIEKQVKHYLVHKNIPIIEIRKYKSKWGCCYYKENKIKFNLYLIHLSKDLIDYVIVHELSHFKVHNHSSLFYKEIEKRMPDYKERIKKLKKEQL